MVGVADALKGQVAMAFVVPQGRRQALTDADAALAAGGRDHEAGGRPARRAGAAGPRALRERRCPKTRSGKLLRRAIQAVCEQRDPGDLTTMDDPATLQQIKQLLSSALSEQG